MTPVVFCKALENGPKGEATQWNGRVVGREKKVNASDWSEDGMRNHLAEAYSRETGKTVRPEDFDLTEVPAKEYWA